MSTPPTPACGACGHAGFHHDGKRCWVYGCECTQPAPAQADARGMPNDPATPVPVRIVPELLPGEHARFVRLLARLGLTPEAWVAKKIRDAIRDHMD